MDNKGLSLKKTVWSQLDRKAGAIIELTIRQLRHRLSTWVVLSVGILLMLLLLAFYVDSVRDGFESIDNDGDAVDEDGDGYPLGQEIKYGHSDFDFSQYPGVGEYIPVGETAVFLKKSSRKSNIRAAGHIRLQAGTWLASLDPSRGLHWPLLNPKGLHGISRMGPWDPSDPGLLRQSIWP